MLHNVSRIPLSFGYYSVPGIADTPNGTYRWGHAARGTGEGATLLRFLLR